MSFLDKVLKVFVGDKSKQDVSAIQPIVDKIKTFESALEALSHDELRAKTEEFKAKIAEARLPLNTSREEFLAKAENTEDIDEREDIYLEVDKIDDLIYDVTEEVLNDILPEAFAVVKETAKRFVNNTQIKVTANAFDREISGENDYVTLDGDRAIWANSWDAAGKPITWDMIHYDVQLIGGVAMHQGKIAEMQTGEGKTLVATLPVYLNALAGKGVHLVTVNDYLAKRDSAWMAPIFQFHGMSVDCIDYHRPNSDARRKAYNADITYGTNNEFGFDYLRDNMAHSPEDLVQRPHHYAIVDEVDSVLVDDARTPLIISGPVPKGDEHEFDALKPKVEQIEDVQRKYLVGVLAEAKKLIAAGDTKEGGFLLLRAYRGIPKNKALIKYLSEEGIKQLLQKTENQYMQDNNREMPKVDAELYYVIDEKNNQVELSDKGVEFLSGEDDPNFFVMPEMGTEIAKIESQGLSSEEEANLKEDLFRDFAIKSERIHTLNQLLKAYALFEKDNQYVVMDNKVMIVDEQTGRIMDGRRYSDGLHQAIEAKENVKVEDATQTYATITLQNYFRMYHKLSGMTGTAETEAGELWDIYKLDVVVIPTNKPIVRDDRQDKVYKTVREKFNAVTDEIIEMREAGRPVLVGTTSVEISEILSRMLNMRKIKHQVLNAKQHAKEADVVAEAGKPGTVTIATNMAGRGTDIKLTPESKSAGGLAIVGTERHESRRVDRQLRGRSGRQGDPGSSQFFVSLEDNLMRLFGSDRIAKLMDRMGLEEGEVIQHSMISKSIERAQKKVEENNFGTRKRLLEYDDVMNSQREVIYKRRKNALYGERLQLDIMNMMFDVCENIVANAKGADSYDDFRLSVLGALGIDYEITEDDFKAANSDELTNKLYNATYENYKRKNQQISEKALPIFKDIQKAQGATVTDIMVPFTDQKKQIGVVTNLERNINSEGKDLILSMEKICTLAIIDEAWKEHLREMDDLKQSVQNAVYEQKDPLLIYKFEGFELFKRFIGKLNEDTVAFLMKLDLPVQDSSQLRAAASQRQRQKLQESKADSGSVLSGGKDKNRPPVEKQMPIKSDKIVGRNDRVTVQYTDGSVKKGVKYKTVEEDIKGNKCVMIDE